MNSKIVPALIVLLALLLAGCSQQTGADVNGNTTVSGMVTGNTAGNGADGMNVVGKGDTIKAEYVGTFEDGNVFDKSEGRGPLEFVVGAGQMIAGFDEAVVGMKLNEEKNVTIPPEKAYGPADAGQRVDVPLAQIQGDSNVEVGTVLYTSTGMPATVVEINGEMAVVEVKHPLAGKTLNFWIKVTSITKTTQ